MTEKLITYREAATALSFAYLNHDQRREQMIVLWNMIDRELQKTAQSDYRNSLQTLMDILAYATTCDTLTHTGVKAALRLFITTAHQAIERQNKSILYTTGKDQSLTVPFPFEDAS